MRILSIAANVAASIAIASPVAADAEMTDLTIENAWARASAGAAKNGVAYMAITNSGSADDRLVAAHTDRAARAELHSHVVVNGIMKMRPVEAVDLPHGSTVNLAPGSYHVMLMNLNGPLQEGERFPLELTFETAGVVVVEVAVGGIGASAPTE